MSAAAAPAMAGARSVVKRLLPASMRVDIDGDGRADYELPGSACVYYAKVPLVWHYMIMATVGW